MSQTLKVDLAVIGAGPGGYTAAFRAADLGLNVALIEGDAPITAKSTFNVWDIFFLLLLMRFPVRHRFANIQPFFV